MGKSSDFIYTFLFEYIFEPVINFSSSFSTVGHTQKNVKFAKGRLEAFKFNEIEIEIFRRQQKHFEDLLILVNVFSRFLLNILIID